ncbi:riboflavin synthase [Clostridium sediminicola]|uniref:riboflavin synthase n=1 Tax=Clostridium sediminicola TaxID=3114879 RepID=UPI0031F26C3C
MFTGLIEEIGKIKKIDKSGNSAKITILANKILKEVKLGDSISTNGVCLTVTKFTENEFTVDVMPETMNRSNLGNLKTGSKVNLERAMQVGDRFGGHIVSGHIDGVGYIINLKNEDNATWVSIEVNDDILKYIVEKGSVAIDGISLTVAYVDEKIFKISLIPLTKEETTLLSKGIGERVNIECDIVGKYVERLIGFNKKEDKTENKISMDFLRENGF